MSRDMRRRDFIATATASGFVGISGCGQSDPDTRTTRPNDPATQTTASTETGTRTPRPNESQSAGEEYLSGEAVSIFGNPLANATVRILAKPEDSYTSGGGIQPHEELGRAATQSDGSFRFDEFPASDFERLRQERDLVMVLFTHPDGWFASNTNTTDLVFSSESILERIRPELKTLVQPTVVTDDAGRRRGVVSVWKYFLNDDPTQQRVGVEVTATNHDTDQNVYDIDQGDLTLGTGSFSLEVPEQGIEIDYENVIIERADPSGDIIGDLPGTEEPSKAIKKWHPARSVNGLELGVPARFLTRRLYTELTEEDIDRAEEKRKVVNYLLGATPVVGDVMQLISAMQIFFDIFDADEGTDPSQWPSVGNALDRSVDRNVRDVVTAGVNQNVVSAVMKVPYRVTDECSHDLAVRGLWQGEFGAGRIGHRVSATAPEQADAGDRGNDTECESNGGETVLEDFEDGTLDGWTGSDKMQIIDTDAAVGDRCGGIVFDGSERSGQSARYDDGGEHTPNTITFWIRTTSGENPDDEWAAYGGNDNKFLELHNHGNGSKVGTMLNGNIVGNWIMDSHTWYKIHVRNISWEDETLGSVQVIDPQGTEQVTWSDIDFQDSNVNGFQKFEIINMNANMSRPATTFVDRISLT